MKDSEADIAIGVLNKLIDQELEAVRAATRDGNTPFVGYAQTRHNAFLYARDEIRKALAAAVDERGAGNPFLPQRDELVTQDMHTCDLCGRWCSSPVYSIGLIYGGQDRTRQPRKTGLRHRINKEPDLPAGIWHYHKPDYHAGGNRTNVRTNQRIPTNHHQHHNKHQPNNTSARRCVPRLRRRMRCRRHHVREMRWADARLAAGISIMVGFAA